MPPQRVYRRGVKRASSIRVSATQAARSYWLRVAKISRLAEFQERTERGVQ